jgi:hypothetical protein
MTTQYNQYLFDRIVNGAKALTKLGLDTASLNVAIDELSPFISQPRGYDKDDYAQIQQARKACHNSIGCLDNFKVTETLAKPCVSMETGIMPLFKELNQEGDLALIKVAEELGKLAHDQIMASGETGQMMDLYLFLRSQGF